ncbi:hypothetical protein OAM01_01205 [bacterium]|nr:hypothetical protein [bacterium]
MKTQDMHIGMHVTHPDLGVGEVIRLGQGMAEIEFETGKRELSPENSSIEPLQSEAHLNGLKLPLEDLVKEVVQSTVDALELERPGTVVEDLAQKWQDGRMVLHPKDTLLQPKEVDLETFFHKIVMMRNNLRVLEQRVNNSKQLSEADKFDIQQYISRCYGSMTTFNVMFRNKEDQFSSK